MTKTPSFLVRIILVIMLLTGIAGILIQRNRADPNYEENVTRRTLKDNTRGIDAYISQQGKAPSDLLAVAQIGIRLTDAWGAKLIYQRCGDEGYVIYSVGKNGVDDGGTGDDVFAEVTPSRRGCK